MNYTQSVGRPTFPTQIFGASGVVSSFYLAEDVFRVKFFRAFLALLRTLFARSFARLSSLKTHVAPKRRKRHNVAKGGR